MGKGQGFVIAGLMVAMLGAVSLSLGSPARGQESTPVVDGADVEVAPGVTFDLLPATEDPPSLYRLEFAPQATLFFAGDPAISLVYVESGTITLNMNAAVTDSRSDATPENTTLQSLGQGDYFVLPPLVAGEMGNDGEEPASIVIAAITPGLFPTPSGTPVAG